MKKKFIIWAVVGTISLWVMSILLWMIVSPTQPVSKYLASIAVSPVSLYCSLSGGSQSIYSESNYLTIFNVPGDSCEYHSLNIIDPGFDIEVNTKQQDPTLCRCGENSCWTGSKCVEIPQS